MQRVSFTCVGEIRKHFFCKLVLVLVEQRVVSGVWEHDSAGLPVELNPNLLRFLLERQRSAGGRPRAILSSVQTDGPHATLGARREPLFTLHAFSHHPQRPLAAVTHLHVPAVPAGAQALGAQDALVEAEALGVVRDLLVFLGEADGGEVFGQSHADVCGVGVEDHGSWRFDRCSEFGYWRDQF